MPRACAPSAVRRAPNYKPPTTGDSGVLLYVGLAVMAIGGSAAVVTRKKERT